MRKKSFLADNYFFRVLEKLTLRRTKRNSVLGRLKTSLEIQLVFQIALSIFLSGNWIPFISLPETVQYIRSVIIKYSCMYICQGNIIFNAIKAFSGTASLASYQSILWELVIKLVFFVTEFFLMTVFLTTGGTPPQRYCYHTSACKI